MKVNLKNLIDDAQCYDTVREMRRSEENIRFVIPKVLSGEGTMRKTLKHNMSQNLNINKYSF